jgi:hypothetical protein
VLSLIRFFPANVAVGADLVRNDHQRAVRRGRNNRLLRCTEYALTVDLPLRVRRLLRRRKVSLFFNEDMLKRRCGIRYVGRHEAILDLKLQNSRHHPPTSELTVAQ